MGLQAAANIAKGEHNDLWGINTNYEELYQESFIITKTRFNEKNFDIKVINLAFFLNHLD